MTCAHATFAATLALCCASFVALALHAADLAFLFAILALAAALTALRQLVTREPRP